MDKLIKILTVQSLLVLFFASPLYAQDLAEIFSSGEKAFSQGKYLIAEKKFDQVLKKDSDNFKVLRAQADTKIKLKKFQDQIT